MFDVNAIWNMLKGRNDIQRARISAYVLAPGIILGFTLSGVLGSGLAIDLEKPVTISELRTEISEKGAAEPKRGVVIIAEPVSAEYRIPIGRPKKIWSSLDEETARANTDHLTVYGDGINSKQPS